MFLDNSQGLYADINSNDKINVLDTLYIQEITLNMEDIPVEKPTIPDEYRVNNKPIQLMFIPVV